MLRVTDAWELTVYFPFINKKDVGEDNWIRLSLKSS